MTQDRPPSPRRRRFGISTTNGAAPPAPTDSDVLADELNRISARLQRTIADGREAFSEGSDSYDRAVVAIIRLAALFENEHSRFGALLSVATPRERLGIRQTRNIAAHVGYAFMDEDMFWETATVHMPDFIAKVRTANGL